MPALISIAIEYYGGFYERREISPAISNGEPGSGLTVLVGPNNSGKTTILNALKLVADQQRRPIDIEHRHRDQPLIIAVKNDEGQEKSITNPDGGAVTRFNGEEDAYPLINHLRLVPSRRAWSPYANPERLNADGYWATTLRRDRAEDSNLVRRLAGLTEAEKGRYDELLKRLLPELNSWRIELSRGQTFVEYETHSGARHAADLFGDGMASLFRVALCIFDSEPGHIVAIDEPELSLHPQAQKALAAVLAEVANNRQVLIATHSPYFINWSDVSNGAAIYRLTQERGGVRVGKLTEDTFDILQRFIADWQKPHVLDAVSREIFFADEVVFFEGQEDVALIRKFAEDNELPSPAAFGYGAGGSGNMRYFLRMAADLGIPAAAIYDGDKADEQAEVEKAFPDVMTELLPTQDIRDKPKRDENGKDTDEIEKQGIFDKHGVVKLEHTEYVADLLHRLRSFFDE